MKSLKWLVSGLVLATGVAVVSCTQHDSPLVSQNTDSRIAITGVYDFSAQLDGNSAENRNARSVRVAFATSESDPFVPQAPFPILYLLHDFAADEDYFEQYSLQQIVDDMYAKHEIGRMLIVTVDASNYFGGSFYRNSATTGDYEEMVDALISSVESTYRFHSRAGKAARAIGGHGMGGYGAFRYALDHPDMFGSISSSCAPLSFGDPGSRTGLWDEDNGLMTQVFEENSTGLGDPNIYSALSQGWEKPRTMEFFAMASAFTPHPLRVFDSVGCAILCCTPFNCICKDTVCGIEFFSGRPRGANTLSFTSDVDTFGVGVDVLFSSAGEIDSSLWAIWRDSGDVTTVFNARHAQTPGLWSDVAIYIDVGEDCQFGHLEQNRDFRDELSAAGLTPAFYEEYTAAGPISATHADQVAARLRKIIKFHSDELARPGDQAP